MVMRGIVSLLITKHHPIARGKVEEISWYREVNKIAMSLNI